MIEILIVSGSASDRIEKWQQVKTDFESKGWVHESYFKGDAVDDIISYRCSDCGGTLTPTGFRLYNENREVSKEQLYALCLKCRNFCGYETLALE